MSNVIRLKLNTLVCQEELLLEIVPLNWSGPAILVDAICLAFQFNRKRLVDGPEAF